MKNLPHIIFNVVMGLLLGGALVVCFYEKGNGKLTPEDVGDRVASIIGTQIEGVVLKGEYKAYADAAAAAPTWDANFVSHVCPEGGRKLNKTLWLKDAKGNRKAVCSPELPSVVKGCLTCIRVADCDYDNKTCAEVIKPLQVKIKSLEDKANN